MSPSAANDATDEAGGVETWMMDVASEVMNRCSLFVPQLLGRASVNLRRVPMKPAVSWF